MQSGHCKASTPASSQEPDLQQPDMEASTNDAAVAIAADSPRPIHGWRWGLAVFAILSSVFLFSLDQTIVAGIIHDMLDHLGEVEKLPWVSVTFLLAAAGTVNFWAKMYDLFDPKWLYIICLLGFEIGSAVCGASPSMNVYIIGRAIAGLGGAGMYSGAIVLLSIFSTQIERPRYFTMLAGTFGIGTVLGSSVGGALADTSATWRWAFYKNLCIGGLFAPIYLLYLPSQDPRPGDSFLARCREIDYIGSILQVGAFGSSIVAVSFGGVLYSWNSATIIALFVLSGVLSALLGFQQSFTVFTTLERRVFPIHYVKSKEMSFLFSQTITASTTCFVAIYFLPLYVHRVHRVQSDQALPSSIRFLPCIIVIVFASILSGGLMAKFKYYLPRFLFGFGLIIISSSMLLSNSLTSSAAYTHAASFLESFGWTLVAETPFAIAQRLVLPEKIS